MPETLLSPLKLLKKFCVSDYVERNTEKAVSCLSTDIHWFGTSDVEDVYNIYEAREYIEAEISKSPMPYHIEFSEESEHIISPGAGTAAAKMRIEAEGLAIMCRITVVTELEDAGTKSSTKRDAQLSESNFQTRPKICDMHMSIPEGSQERGEYFPFEFLKKHESEVVRDFVNNMMPGGIWGFYLEPGFPLSMINQAMLLSLGYKNEGEYRVTIDDRVINAIHPEDRQILNAAISEGLSKGDDIRALLRIRRSDDSYFWADTHGIRSRDSGNRETMICLCLDAAELAAADERIVEEYSAKLDGPGTRAAGAEAGQRGVGAEAGQRGVGAEAGQSSQGDVPGQQVPPAFPRGASDLSHVLRGRFKNRWNTAVMILIVAAMIGAVAVFAGYLMRRQWDAATSAIRTASLSGSEYVSNAIRSDQMVLSNIAWMIGQGRAEDAAALLAGLDGSSCFRETIAAFEDGTFCSSLGGGQDEIAASVEQLQFSGRDDISKTYYGSTGRNQIAYRSAICSDGEKTGELYGTVELSKYYVPSVMEFYGGEGFSYVIDVESGDFIIYTTRTMSQGAYRSFYTALLGAESPDTVSELKRILQSGSTGSTVINMLGTRTYVYFVPIDEGFSRYLITMVPYEVMRAESAGMVSIVMSFIIALLMAAALILMFHNRIAATKTRERGYRDMILHLLSENLDSMLFIYDAKTRSIDYISENINRILGISYKAFMGDGFLDSGLMPPSDKQAQAIESLRKKHNFSMDYASRNPANGKQQLLRLSGYVPNEAEWQNKWIFCVDDRTDEVLKERRLEQAVTEAEEANTAKTQFLANMSHDIRTPMNGIIGMTQLALMEGVDAKTMRGYIEKISNSSAFLLSLINDILDMSKIESGTIELHPRAYLMKEMCVYLDSVIRPLSSEKDMELIFNLDETLCVSVDQQRLNQILFNLLSNAVKYTHRNGRVALTVRTHPRGPRMTHMTLEVEDNGSGMTPEFQKKMFMPFTQENRKIEGMNGTGLGLAIVKKLVDLMGGTIRVESNVGQGSHFIIELDVPLAEAGKVQNRAEGESDDISLKNIHVLLCEDNAINQEIMMSILEAMGTDAELAANGKDGVDQYSAHNPGYYNVILMDCRMPVMDGYEAARAIRSMGREDSVTLPIIALTADAFEEDRKRCMEAGMSDFLAKPVEIEELKKVLSRNIPGGGKQ